MKLLEIVKSWSSKKHRHDITSVITSCSPDKTSFLVSLFTSQVIRFQVIVLILETSSLWARHLSVYHYSGFRSTIVCIVRLHCFVLVSRMWQKLRCLFVSSWFALADYSPPESRDELYQDLRQLPWNTGSPDFVMVAGCFCHPTWLLGGDWLIHLGLNCRS